MVSLLFVKEFVIKKVNILINITLVMTVTRVNV